MYELLAGVTIVEVSAYVAAPLAGMTLAQLGAEVIKIEPPSGGPDAGRWPLAPNGASLFWRELNKAKRLIPLDLRLQADADRFLEILDSAGRVLLTNIPLPASLAERALRQRFPDLILVEIQGRPDGSSAVDYIVQPGTGFPEITGSSTAAGPINTPFPAWDISAGYLTGLTLLAALWRRQRSGEGAYAKIALSDVALAAVCNLGFLAGFATSGAVRPRDGNDVYGAFGRDFECADSKRVMIVAITGRQWRSVVNALNIADEIKNLERTLATDLADEGNRYIHRERLAELMRPWFQQRSLAEIERQLAGSGVAWAPYRSLGDTLKHLASGSDATMILETIEQPDVGSVLSAGIPVVFQNDRRKPLLAAPKPARRPRLAGQRLPRG
ncbi:MAG: CoA transferase [Proteobacteria bacterium]|nr:CoA transferase [Pseudomonadota bacterium]